jgi:hypothetical protein
MDGYDSQKYFGPTWGLYFKRITVVIYNCSDCGLYYDCVTIVIFASAYTIVKLCFKIEHIFYDPNSSRGVTMFIVKNTV